MAADNSITPTDASTEPLKNDPKNGAVYQQRMKAWYPILHPVWVIGALFVIGVVFVPVGTFVDRASWVSSLVLLLLNEIPLIIY